MAKFDLFIGLPEKAPTGLERDGAHKKSACGIMGLFREPSVDMRMKGADGMRDLKTGTINPGAMGYGLLFSLDTLIALSDPVAGLFDLRVLSVREIIPIACFALAALRFSRLDGAIASPRIPAIGAAFGTVGAGVILVLQMTGGTSPALTVAALVLISVSQCLLFLRYYRAFSSRPLAEVALSLALCHVLSGALLFAVVACGVRSAAVVLALFVPAAVVVLLGKFERGNEKGAGGLRDGGGDMPSAPSIGPAPASQGAGGSWAPKLPLRPLLLLAITIFMRCISTTPLVDERVAVDFSGVMVAALVVFAIVLSGRTTIRFKLLYDIAMFDLAVGLFFYAVGASLGAQAAGMGSLAGFLTDAGFVTFDIFLVTLLCNACQRYSLSTVLTFSLMEIVVNLSFGLGSYASSVLIAQDPSVRSLAAFGCALVLVAAYVLLLTDKDYRTSWGTSRESGSRPSMAEFYYTLPEVCSALAQQHGLTRREEEVLVLLAQRKTIPDIEAELFISNSTAKAHCKGIYRKLGVHKREELLRLVGHPSSANDQQE